MLVLLSLAGCAGPRTEWVKPGASAEEFRLTREACQRRAQRYDFLGADAGQTDVYRSCMEDAGWRRERAP